MQSIKDFRENGAKRYQKKEIAAALGVSVPTLTAIEREQKKHLTVEMAEKLGDYFGVDGLIFLGGKSN